MAKEESNVRELGFVDLGAILKAGAADFLRAPGPSIVIASIYTLGGWLLAANLVVFDLPYLVYPLAMGFALIAPFIAVAFYAVSREIERGRAARLTSVWSEVRAASGRDLRWMALITAFAFFIWMDIAAMLTLSFFGAAALDASEFFGELFGTTRGWIFIFVGHLVGAFIALLVFSISVVSFPMLFDRDVDVLTAIATSTRLVRRNPVVMALWCAIITATIVLAIATGLLLLPIVMPVLGYASWYLYRRGVV